MTDIAELEKLSKTMTACGEPLGSRKRWEEDRHASIADSAVRMLRDDRSTSVPEKAKWFLDLWQDGNSAFAKKVKDGLLDADTKPPYADWGWESHFYDPDTKKNYRGKSDPTAMTQALRLFYSSAEKKGSSKDLYGAYELGLALHYLTDLSQPMHSSNFANLFAGGSPLDLRHRGFERYAEKNLDRFHALPRANRHPLGMDTAYFPEGVGGTIEIMARHAKKIFVEKVEKEAAKKVRVIPNAPDAFDNDWGSEADDALKLSIPYAEFITATFIFSWIRFDVDNLIRWCYRQILGRDPDDTGKRVYRRVITEELGTVRRIISELGSSEEFYGSRIRGNGGSEVRSRLFRAFLYLEHPENHPDLKALLDYKLPDPGISHAECARAVDRFVNGDEYRSRFGDHMIPCELPLPIGDGSGWNGNYLMSPGDALFADRSLMSRNKTYELHVNREGRLELYKDKTPVWNSPKAAGTGAYCIMQLDGNLALCDRDSKPVWSSRTEHTDGSYLTLQDDGNVVIYDPAGIAIWDTGKH